MNNSFKPHTILLLVFFQRLLTQDELVVWIETFGVHPFYILKHGIHKLFVAYTVLNTCLNITSVMSLSQHNDRSNEAVKCQVTRKHLYKHHNDEEGFATSVALLS